MEDAQERVSLALAAAHSRDTSPSGRLPSTHGHTHTSRADYYQQQLMAERDRIRLQGEALLQGKGPFCGRNRRSRQGPRAAPRRAEEVHLFSYLWGRWRGCPHAAQRLPLLTPSRSVNERMLSRELGQLPPPALALSPSPSGTTFIHPLTGKPLDPNSPLALALAARERALTSQSQSPSTSPEPRTKQERAGQGGIFMDTQTKESQLGGGAPASPPFPSQTSKAGGYVIHVRGYVSPSIHQTPVVLVLFTCVAQTRPGGESGGCEGGQESGGQEAHADQYSGYVPTEDRRAHHGPCHQ